ncbi:ISLre2 family transposase [Streptococcus sp. S784/96/1]|uniref:ISLre2 family transposase n=1 Tax=Streptococcus sp. S784/96/1 TaxID=2653499 RepID=UPI0013871487|nr:ISLre2 family transposase [Streptococcus sp. S784/96/1]
MNERELYASFQLGNVNDFIKSLADYDQAIAPAMRAAGYKCKNRAKRTVLFTFGEVTFSRNRWYKDQQCRIPVDEKLGLAKNTRFSLELLYQIAELATTAPYRKVAKIIELMYHLHITKDTVLKAVKLSERLLAEREDYRFFQEDKPVKKLKVKFIYIEGDGVAVKSYDESGSKHLELAHFVIHTGSKNGCLLNKKEVVSLNNRLARDQVIDYIYNNFELNEDTVLITNSDGGHGYTPYIFKEIAKAINVKRHEHFWDSYHVNKKLTNFFKSYSEDLLDQAFLALSRHDKQQLRTVLDTTESLLDTEDEKERFVILSKQLKANFQYTKSARMRGLPETGIGVMESQHRKLTYRMKNRGMYWSRNGADTMSQMILLSSKGELRDLFFGSWREDYERYQELEGLSGAKVKKQAPKTYELPYRGRSK